MTANKLTSSQALREAFLQYFSTYDHAILPSSSLVPFGDATLLFTNAGMVQFKDAFLGLIDMGKRATTSQRCVRAGGKHNDLDQVGYTARHHTFFEMLGNFSFGDYFKREAIQYAWRFLTEVLHIPADKLWVTVYEEDSEAEAIWLEELKVSPARFSRCGKASNFWSMGDTGPCGPCTEIFYDHGPAIAGGPPGSPDEDGDRYVEIWNLVFMQYNRAADGTLTALPKPSVDTGMGLERLTAVMQGVHNNYDTDLFQPLIQAAAKLAHIDDNKNTSLRVIADHIRACSFLIVDGVLPSNEGRGYVLRRIIRRALRHGNKLNIPLPFFYQLVEPLTQVLGQAYPELGQHQEKIKRVLLQEEEQFAKTLSQGMRLFEQALGELEGKQLSGELIFKLYDTYGFPPDLTADMARERDLTLDIAGFEAAMEQQRLQSQAASQFAQTDRTTIQTDVVSTFEGYDKLTLSSHIVDVFVDGISVDKVQTGQQATLILSQTPFYAESGGQVGDIGVIQSAAGHFIVEDTKKIGLAILHHGHVDKGHFAKGEAIDATVNEAARQATRANHSATHLLHSVLQKVLDNSAEQKGSLVAPDRLRFDFSYNKPLTQAQRFTIENMVNQYIRANVEAKTAVGSYKEAIAAGAKALFGEKYTDVVRSIAMGDLSHELCGGTHVARTGDIGLFKIVSESGIAAGIRRIEALTGDAAIAFTQQQTALLDTLSEQLKIATPQLLERVKQQQIELKTLEQRLAQLQQQQLAATLEKLIATQLKKTGIYHTLVLRCDDWDEKLLKLAATQLCQRLGEHSLIFLVCLSQGRIHYVAAAGNALKNKLSAQALVSFAASYVSGKGGGRAELAQGSGTDVSHVDKLLHDMDKHIQESLRV